MTLFTCAIFLLFSTTAALCQDNSSAPSPQRSSDPRIRGEQAFTENGCPQCHTVHQHGGTKGPDLSDAGHRLSDDQIRTQILKGGKQMPAFGQILKSSETDDLVAYVHSLREDEKTTKKQ
jgi:mono/diheme cytochrome c family protein